MRKFSMSALIASAAVAATAWAQGQSSANYLSQAFVRVTNTASGAAKLGNFGYDSGVSILAAWVNCRDSVIYYVPLVKGTNYMFVAAGDNDSQDVDIEIQDENSRLVAKDNRVAADAMITMTAPSSGWFTLKLTLTKARDDLPCVCVACILKENGHDIPLKNLDESASKVLRLFAETDRSLQGEKKRLEFRRSRNQWGLYGAVLRPGESISVTNIDMGVGRRLLLAMGDKNTEDVDLFLLDNNGTTLAQDTKINPDASVVFSSQPGRYGIKMLNYKGSGPSVVMTGIFDVIQK